MAAMAPDRQDPRRTASIANLILPSSEVPTDRSSLLSLSHLAASMQPIETSTSSSQRRRRAAAEAFARTSSVPAALREQTSDHRPHHPQQQQRSQVPVQLGVARPTSKRISRTKSAFASRNSLRAVAAAAVTSARDSNVAPTSPAGTPATSSGGNGGNIGALPSPASLALSPTPSPAALKPMAAMPMGGGIGSKHTSASNSIESCVPPPDVRLTAGHASVKREGLGVGGGRYSTIEFASNALMGMKGRRGGDGMEIDGEFELREPSSSSHDARLISRPSRGRTTPDAKRAQNRESAKRFRVAQKKRWADLQETVEKKDKEIARLKDMLQEVTNQNLAERRGNAVTKVNQKADALAMAELDLFVKLMCSSGDLDRGNKAKAVQPPIAASIGALYRVIVAKLDGTVLGVRHLNADCGNAMGGEVGSLLWDHVHSSDSAHLRFTVVHASRMASVMGEEPIVFSYRRKEMQKDKEQENGNSDEVEKESYMRMKGCIYPLADENGEISSVILAEFVEI